MENSCRIMKYQETWQKLKTEAQNEEITQSMETDK
jgi:hypothetical protein